MRSPRPACSYCGTKQWWFDMNMREGEHRWCNLMCWIAEKKPLWAEAPNKQESAAE